MFINREWYDTVGRFITNIKTSVSAWSAKITIRTSCCMTSAIWFLTLLSRTDDPVFLLRIAKKVVVIRSSLYWSECWARLGSWNGTRSSLITFPALGQFCAARLTVQSGCCRPSTRNNVIAVLKRSSYAIRYVCDRCKLYCFDIRT